MVAGDLLLDDGGVAGGGESREQNGGFDLGGRDRKRIDDRDDVGRAAQGQGQRVLALLAHAEAHLLQRVEHAAHRAPAERSIAHEDGFDRVPRDDAGHQSHAGAGIAEIENAARAGEAADPNAVNAPGLICRPLDGGAERPHDVRGAQDVLAFQKTSNGGLADGQRPQDQSAMGNRFVPGHAGPALHGAA